MISKQKGIVSTFDSMCAKAHENYGIKSKQKGVYEKEEQRIPRSFVRFIYSGHVGGSASVYGAGLLAFGGYQIYILPECDGALSGLLAGGRTAGTAAGSRRESPAVCGGEGPGRIGEDCPRSPEGLQHDGSGRGGLWRCRSAFGSVQLLRAASVEGV